MTFLFHHHVVFQIGGVSRFTQTSFPRSTITGPVDLQSSLKLPMRQCQTTTGSKAQMLLRITTYAEHHPASQAAPTRGLPRSTHSRADACDSSRTLTLEFIKQSNQFVESHALHRTRHDRASLWNSNLQRRCDDSTGVNAKTHPLHPFSPNQAIVARSHAPSRFTIDSDCGTEILLKEYVSPETKTLVHC